MSKDIFDQNTASRFLMSMQLDKKNFNSLFKINVSMEPFQFEYLPGDKIRIMVDITNITSYDIHKIILIENPLLEGKFVEFPSNCIMNANQLSYVINSLSPLETKTIITIFEIEEEIIPGLYQMRFLIASANYYSSEQIFNINVRETNTNAKITLIKSVSSTTVKPNDEIEFCVSITNDSEIDAHHLIVIDNNNLPGFYTPLAEDVTYTDGILTYHIPFLGKKSTIARKLSFKVASYAIVGNYFNSVLVRSDNTEEVTDVITISVITPILDVNKTVKNTTLKINHNVVSQYLDYDQELEIVYIIKNIGRSTAQHVLYTNQITIPGFFISVPDRTTITLNQLNGIIPIIAPDESIEIKLVYKVSLEPETLVFNNSYQAKLLVTSNNITPIVSNLVFQINQKSIKVIQIQNKKNNHYQNGDTITFLSEITNTSTKDIVKNVKIIDTIDLPGFFKIKPCQTNDNNMHSYCCEIGDLLPGQNYIAASKYVIQTDDNGVYQNKITVTSNNTSPTSNILDIYVGL